MRDTQSDSLTGLQRRLTSRLQDDVTARVNAPAWLAVLAGDRRLLLPMSHTSEVGPWLDLHPIPYVKPWFLGVINWRGVLCGVVDLAAFLAHADPRRNPAALEQCQLVNLNPVLDAHCVFLVDDILGTRAMQDFVRSDTPDGAAESFFGHVYTDAEGAAWQELDLQSLVVTPAFADIRA